MNRFTRILVPLMLIVLGITFSQAQTTKGTVTGIVTDPTGAVVAKATVTLTDKATNISRSTVTNNTGLYRFDAVNLGTYELTVEAAGFAKGTVTAVNVSANKTVAADIKLAVGSGSDSVTVEATGLELQTTEQVRIENIGARRVADLPVVGQNSLNLLLTVPGVIATDMGGSLNSGIGSVNGARPRGNSFLLEGVENNDISVVGPAIEIANQDAIQEVSIQTSNFSAEYGRAGGAVVNQVLKSGTNSLHGTAAWVYRSEVFNASDQDERLGFTPGGTTPLKSKFKENIPAFTLGGPVKLPWIYDGHDRTFFFVAGQWDRFSSGGSVVNFRVPTAAGVSMLQSLASAGCTRAQLYLDAIDGLVAPTQLASGGTVNLAIPATTFATMGASSTCNGTARTGMVMPIGIASRFVPSLALQDNHQVRIDHKINDRQQLSARWAYQNDFQPNATVAVSKFFDADATSRNLTAGLTHSYAISPTLSNEFRLSYARINPQFPITNAGIGETLPSFSYAGSSSLSGFGTSATFPQGRTANTWQFQDVVTLVRGNHSIRMGADYLRQIAKQVAPANVRGAVAYTACTNVVANNNCPGGITGFANFLDDFGGNTGAPSRVFGTPAYRPNLFRQSYFVQDSWKMRPNLTLNAGLRYENFGQPANFFKFPVNQLDPANFGSTEKVNQDNNNFGPTVGFAYTPRIWESLLGKEKTVIRGGFQISYDTFFNNMLSNMAGANPNLLGNIPINPPTLTGANSRGTSQLSTKLAGLTPVALNPTTNASSQFTKNIVNPYTMRWSFGVQRELPSNVIMDVSYVGSGARKLFQTVELNPFLPNAAHTGPSTTRMIPTIGSRQPRASIGSSNYHALQTEFRRALKQTVVGGLEFTSSYTWSKSTDSASEIFVSNQNGGATAANGSSIGSSRWILLLQPGRGLDHGPSDFDVTHRWVSTAVWDIRGPQHGILSHVLGGWGLSAVIPVQSGSPFTIFNNADRDFDGSSLADRPDLGSLSAPADSYALAVPTATCSTGLRNPIAGACVTANDVRYVQVLGGPTSDPGANTVRRNSLRTPGSWLVDMNVLKRFSINERFKLEYRAEIFNLANHQNFNYTPAGTVLDGSDFLDYSSGNPLGSRSSESRKMRMALKIIF
jgi:outer membrane receptor protein involved in Fe transport